MGGRFFLGFASLLLATAAAAAEPAAAPDLAVRAHSLDVLVRRIDHYVDQTKKPEIVSWLKAEREALLRIADRDAFLKALNAGLYKTSGDKHLSVFLRGPEPPPADDFSAGTYGIGRVERLAGGAAYLEVTGFSNAPESVAAVDRAMARLEGAPALILDLRTNGGGGETSFLRLLGHLFPSRTEIGAIEWRECAPPPADRPDACTQVAPRLQRRFTDAPPKPAFPTQPVYVLVSAGSFSAAEAAAHELQVQKRAMIVGERTPGGGNPSAGMDLESDYVVIMPIGRGRPLSGPSFEGIGVAPDIAVPADLALAEAVAFAARAKR